MIGVDTNVLLRYFVVDDEAQNKDVRRFLGECRKSSEPIFVTCIVLCEFVWSMRRAFRRTEAEILNVIEQLLETELFVIEHDDRVRAAIRLARHEKGDLADYLIGLIGVENGCRFTVTFDRALHSQSIFRSVRAATGS